MKKYLSKFTSVIVALTATTELFSATLQDYVALPLANVGEGKQQVSFYDAWVVAAKPKNSSCIEKTAKALLSASPAELEKITVKGGAKRAVKFLKIAGIKSESLDSSKAVEVGNFVILPFELPRKTRLRAGMNVLVFENVDGKLLYNPSFNDPLVSLVATSDFKNPRETSTVNVTTFDDTDKKTLEALLEKKLPFLCFKNGALLSEREVNGVDNTDVAKFYRNAQDIFYDWKLDDYANYMTQFSRDKFNSQFKSMSENERKKVLGEYFQWKKRYHKVLDAGNEFLILFSRHKPDNEPYDDVAYIRADGKKFAITKFAAEKSQLDLFFSKYIYPKDKYLNLISKKYCNKK